MPSFDSLSNATRLLHKQKLAGAETGITCTSLKLKLAMEPLPNKDLRRLLLFTIFLGSMFGCLYVFVIQRYFADKPSFNLEILQKLEFLKDEFRYNSTGKLDDKNIWKIGGVLDFETIYQKSNGKEKDRKQSNRDGGKNDPILQGVTKEHLQEDIDENRKEIDVMIKKKDAKSSRNSQQKTEPVEKKICLLDKKTLGELHLIIATSHCVWF